MRCLLLFLAGALAFDWRYVGQWTLFKADGQIQVTTSAWYAWGISNGVATLEASDDGQRIFAISLNGTYVGESLNMSDTLDVKMDGVAFDLDYAMSMYQSDNGIFLLGSSTLVYDRHKVLGAIYLEAHLTNTSCTVANVISSFPGSIPGELPTTIPTQFVSQ